MKRTVGKQIGKTALAWMLVASMIVPAISSAMIAKASDQENTNLTDYNSMTMEELFESKEELTWVFAGDSITHNNTYTQGTNGYGEWFEQYLLDSGRKDDSVIITAWGGADIYDFQTAETESDDPSFPATDGSKSDPGLGIYNMITKYNPDVIFIKDGMNDRYKTTEVYEYFYRKMLDSIYDICEKEYKKIPKIVLITPTPISGESLYDDWAEAELKAELGREVYPEADNTDSTLRFRNAIEQIAKDYGLEFIDFRTAFLEESMKLGDKYKSTFFNNGSDGALHPNAAGQYYMFKTLCEELNLDMELPIFDLEYNDFKRAELYVDGTDSVTYDNHYGSGDWSKVLGENSVWTVVGAEQMSGYEGNPVNRSMFRFLDNAMRCNSGVASYRDIRMVNASAPGYTVASVLGEYQNVIDKYAPAALNAQTGAKAAYVVLLLPEVSAVYDAGYVHTQELVTDYKASVQALIAKNTEKGYASILWTPLASADTAINAYIDDYAEAVREIAKMNTDIMFYDANRFMNENMNANEVLKRNWFEEEMYISPLCANDVVRAFYTWANDSHIGVNELSSHSLRYTSDKRAFKGNYIRDYISSDVSVNGTLVTIDISTVKSAYPGLSNVRLAVMPAVAAGNYNKNIVNLTDIATVTVSDSKYTFETPCKNPVIAVYGEWNGNTYRFKDIQVNVITDKTITKAVPTPDGVYLDSLEVVGTPKLAFQKDITNYDVNLYQYQRFVRILANAQEGLEITVNGESVESGEYSQPVIVDKTGTITVKVSGSVDGTQKEKVYTIQLTRPEYPDIIITEVMQDGYYGYDVTGGDNYELIEIYNASGRELNLKDYAIGYKIDYRYTATNLVTEFPSYYFTGDAHTFQANSSAAVTYTGINQITKYSSYWSDNTVSEPAVIPFPADSSMVIWVKFAPSNVANKDAYSKELTYDTLIRALEENKDKYTLSVDGKAVVPVKDQLVVAEIPKGANSSAVANSANITAENANDYFYMNAHTAENASSTNHARNWLFVLDKNAKQDTNESVTLAGNDIISASKQSRLGGTDKLSNVFSYNTKRGMSLVKDEGYWDNDTVGFPHTSDEQGYSNLTSFGAIEYWQKPYDLADKAAPTVNNTTKTSAVKSESANITMNLTDDTDVRYVELYIKKAGETTWTKVTKDFVLQAGMENRGVSKDITNISFVYELGQLAGSVQYYGFVEDGNQNQTVFGTKDQPLEITVAGSISPGSTGEIGTKKTVTVEGQEIEIVIGDVTGDGVVNIVDFMNLRRYLLGIATLNEKAFLAADVTGDNEVNIVDFMRIRSYLMK